MAVYTSPVTGGVPTGTYPPGTQGYANFKNQHTCANGKTCFNWVVPAGQTGTATGTASGYNSANIRVWAYDLMGSRIESATNSVSLPNPPRTSAYRFTVFFLATPVPGSCTLTTASLNDYVCP